MTNENCNLQLNTAIYKRTLQFTIKLIIYKWTCSKIFQLNITIYKWTLQFITVQKINFAQFTNELFTIYKWTLYNLQMNVVQTSENCNLQLNTAIYKITLQFTIKLIIYTWTCSKIFQLNTRIYKWTLQFNTVHLTN